MKHTEREIEQAYARLRLFGANNGSRDFLDDLNLLKNELNALRNENEALKKHSVEERDNFSTKIFWLEKHIENEEQLTKALKKEVEELKNSSPLSVHWAKVQKGLERQNEIDALKNERDLLVGRYNELDRLCYSYRHKLTHTEARNKELNDDLNSYKTHLRACQDALKEALQRHGFSSMGAGIYIHDLEGRTWCFPLPT